MDSVEITLKNAQIRDSIINIGNNQINYYGKNSFENIIYLPSMNISPENAPTAFQEQDIYLVERTKEQKRKVDKAYDQEKGQNNVEKDKQDEELEGPVYDIYINGGQMKMGTIENGIITFTPEYLQMIEKISPLMYQTLMLQQGKQYEISEAFIDLTKDGQELQLNPMEMSKEEIEKQMQERVGLQGQEKLTEQDLEKQKQETKSEEQAIKEIAIKTGMSIEDIKSCASLDPKEKITDSQSFEDITNTVGKYEKVLPVASNSKTQGTSRFVFYGITPKGEVEQVPGFEERDGVNTGKEIYSMNRDGSVVKEKQTSALFMLRNGEEGFSVTIGQYGMIEVDYIRKDPTQNKFIGLTLNTYSEKPTTREVQEFMNDARTTDEELTEIIEKTEHQLDEHGSETTLLQNIDDNPNNDKAIDIDEEIEMHDGTVTTLRQEAEKYNMSPEDYIKYFESARGDCTSDKIMVANLNIEEEREENKDLDRGEQLLEKHNR